MACGTPVIARLRGSVPEVLDDGETGFIVRDVDHAVERVLELSRIDRRGVRTIFEERFTAARMAQNYINLFQSLIDKS
jgi:glycosyltransferase involved in cell wall biosynthesis